MKTVRPLRPSFESELDRWENEGGRHRRHLSEIVCEEGDHYSIATTADVSLAAALVRARLDRGV